jgi:hypothetical protein
MRQISQKTGNYVRAMYATQGLRGQGGSQPLLVGNLKAGSIRPVAILQQLGLKNRRFVI